MIDFACTCEMYRTLSSNAILRHTLAQVCFHWCGADSERGIGALAQCPGLRDLTVTISRRTTAHVTPREDELVRFFGAQHRGPSLAHGGRRGLSLGEARGVDQLLALRGLDAVQVRHVGRMVRDRRADDEKAGLQAMLDHFLLQPRPGDQAQPQGLGLGLAAARGGAE